MKNGLKILAVAFLVGMGVPAAFADDEADARALCEEANRYFFVEKNYEKAVDCYKRAAFRGNAVAMFNLAACYLRGKGVEQNSTIAFDWYEKSADKGYTQAMYNLALCYEYGNGVEKNLPESFLWFKRAAQRHFPPAMFNLARCYENAKGTRRDLKKAALWYEKAAEANHVKAMVKIANCYESGRGIHKNLMAAFDWYLKAAEKDNTEAMFNVATCYRTGKGVPANKTHAFEWYKKAAEAEYANAMANLATCYYFGDGVEKNLEEAARWYRAAAQKGNDLAMLNLAECYRKGEGVEQDLGLAIDWLTKAADRGNKFAEAKLAEWTKLEDAVAENATGESLGSGDVLVAGEPSVPVETTREEAKIASSPHENLPNDKISNGEVENFASLRADVPAKTVPAESVPAESILGNGDTLVADAKSIEKVDLEKDISVPASAEIAKADEVKISEKVALDSGDKSVAVPKTLTAESAEKLAGDKNVAAPTSGVPASEKIVPAEVAKLEEPPKVVKKPRRRIAFTNPDEGIPENANRVADNVLVYIIANENYSKFENDVADVDYAGNDGKIFYQYLNKTYGVPVQNIRYIPNATGKQMEVAIKKMLARAKAYKDSEIIFYYAGHGVPARGGKEVYLLPVDVRPEDAEFGAIELSQFYRMLGESSAGRVCVILDACFSGTRRDDNPLVADRRGVRIAPDPTRPSGNTIVFAAASGAQTAATLPGKKHGLFTYCLLNKLRDSNGDVSYKDLGSYLMEEVPKLSWEENDRAQNPTVSCGKDFDPAWKFAAESE